MRTTEFSNAVGVSKAANVRLRSEMLLRAMANHTKNSRCVCDQCRYSANASAARCTRISYSVSATTCKCRGSARNSRISSSLASNSGVTVVLDAADELVDEAAAAAGTLAAPVFAPRMRAAKRRPAASKPTGTPFSMRSTSSGPASFRTSSSTNERIGTCCAMICGVSDLSGVAELMALATGSRNLK